MTWISIFTGKSGFAASSTAEDVTKGIDGTGLTAIVTGATSGIGLETARVLALRGVHVIMPVRNVEAGQKVKESISQKIPNAKLEVMELDISSLESVRTFASQYCSKGHPLNLLILNAGIMTPPFSLSKDNIELQFATNHVGNFLLTNLLLDTMKKTARESGIEGRIVILSSEVHRVTYKEGIRFDKINDEKSYSPFYAYGQSKLANALHANELSRRLQAEGANITANSLHPGVINTNLARNGGFFSVFLNVANSFLKNIPQGAATTCYVALHPQLKGVSGQYFADSNLNKASKYALDADLAKKLWDFSSKLTKSN
ncbi:short-chain dehydrogenase TIC 32, chloroplastic-like [Cynara cardunculus var. scolymus]|uniref:short-chain dehydrogenase TIC 32, chloroplastic-like n=1 Tax=Cynara cardunculus var. scolymus TaxID=59895 RepID=UPI000D630508|nr:short-chain dehydrogenase TIC 32, chloroplastic-like [Cynara cardunculus var. scolymus]